MLDLGGVAGDLFAREDVLDVEITGHLQEVANLLHVVINGYLHAGTPNGTACNNAGSYFTSLSWIYFVNPAGSAPPTSNHPGGVNIAFADGSVKFVKDSVSPQTWWALGSRAGGEVVSSDSY